MLTFMSKRKQYYSKLQLFGIAENKLKVNEKKKLIFLLVNWQQFCGNLVVFVFSFLNETLLVGTFFLKVSTIIGSL